MTHDYIIILKNQQTYKVDNCFHNEDFRQKYKPI